MARPRSRREPGGPLGCPAVEPAGRTRRRLRAVPPRPRRTDGSCRHLASALGRRAGAARPATRRPGGGHRAAAVVGRRRPTWPRWSAAWADPALAASRGLPADVSPAGAARWIRGEPARRAAGLCLDLVVGAGRRSGDRCSARSACATSTAVRRRGELSWWIAGRAPGPGPGRGGGPAARRTWALSPGGGLVQVWARIDPGERAPRPAWPRRPGSSALGEAGGIDGLGPVAPARRVPRDSSRRRERMPGASVPALLRCRPDREAGPARPARTDR